MATFDTAVFARWTPISDTGARSGCPQRSADTWLNTCRGDASLGRSGRAPDGLDQRVELERDAPGPR